MPQVQVTLTALRRLFDEQAIDGYLVPRADLFQGEEVAPCDERLRYVSGFTGSAGQALITRDAAHLFVDGRYTLQGAQQSPTFDQHDLIDDPAHKLVNAGDAVIGYDPWLMTKAQIGRFDPKKLKAVESNLIDAIWQDRPTAPAGDVWQHPDDLAGESHTDKLGRVHAKLIELGATHAVLTLPDSIAWLMNARGRDLRNTPVIRSLMLLTVGHPPRWFVQQAERITFFDAEPFEAFEAALAELNGPTLVDGNSAPVAVSRALQDPIDAPDPCIAMKAIKNPAEIAGIKAAHRRDGAVMGQFIAWVKTTATEGTLTEMAAAEYLHDLRARDNGFLGDSFDTISGAGPNGAIVHYRVTEASNRIIERDNLYLVDSGGQYRNGTTDITRTIAVGTPTQQMRDDYTRVVKGHIALAQVTFPAGTSGQALDVLARQYLWQVGLDYDHGTGHGVGAVLNVHEGPARIAKPTAAKPVALQAGMLLSNEPGLYRAGQYGIRFENLILVIARPDLSGDRPFLGFETVSFAPLDHDLLDNSLLTDTEHAWIAAYEAQVA